MRRITFLFLLLPLAVSAQEDCQLLNLQELAQQAAQCDSLTTAYQDSIADISAALASSENALQSNCGNPIIIEGKSYATTRIGHQCWMASNLARTSVPSYGTLNTDLDSLHLPTLQVEIIDYDSVIFYNKVSAQSFQLCPNQWHVSSLSDWQELLDFFPGTNSISPYLKTESWGGTNVLNFNAKPVGFSGQINLFDNENSSNHVGRYLENFSDGIGQGWSSSGSIGTTSFTNHFEIFYFKDCFWGGSGCTHSHSIYSPIFTVGPDENFTSVSFYKYVNWSSSCDYDYYFEYMGDSGTWIQLDHESCESSGNRNYNLSGIDTESIQFRLRSTFFEWSRMRVDNFDLRSSSYPGYDTPVSNGTLVGSGNLAHWWTDESNTNSAVLLNSNTNPEFTYVNESTLQSVRCVKD